jgi:hypothetical protein
MTRTREQLDHDAAELIRDTGAGHQEIPELIAEAWQGGREEARRELTAKLGRLIADGQVMSVREAFDEAMQETGPPPPGRVIPFPDPARDEAAEFARPYAAALPDKVTVFRDQYAGLLGGEHALPLADDDSEPAADAAGQRAQFTAGLDDRMAALDARVAAWLARISSRTPEGDAKLTRFVRAALTEDPELGEDPDGRACPDTGACYHGCTTGCWRVLHTSPLGIAGWGNRWPEEIRQAHPDSDGTW